MSCNIPPTEYSGLSNYDKFNKCLDISRKVINDECEWQQIKNGITLYINTYNIQEGETG